MPRNRYTLIVMYMCSCVFIGILYMYRTAVLFGVCHAVVYAYIITAWAGFQLLILLQGQCESLMIGIGARETYSHVFFVSIILSLVVACWFIHQPSSISHLTFGQFGDDWPALHCAPKLREKVNITIFKNSFINNLNF